MGGVGDFEGEGEGGEVGFLVGSSVGDLLGMAVVGAPVVGAVDGLAVVGPEVGSGSLPPSIFVLSEEVNWPPEATSTPFFFTE